MESYENICFQWWRLFHFPHRVPNMHGFLQSPGTGTFPFPSAICVEEVSRAVRLGGVRTWSSLYVGPRSLEGQEGCCSCLLGHATDLVLGLKS